MPGLRQIEFYFRGNLKMNNLIKKIPVSLKLFKEFIRLESASGIILFSVAILALVIDNSPRAYLYQFIFHQPLNIQFGLWQLSEPITFWINDLLMVIFFLLVGLEIKREIVEGELSSLAAIRLPAIAALGGMFVPAILYTMFNLSAGGALRGWAIPTATDITFALAILTLLGPRVPLSLKLFLTALAIFDDIGAIMIIALFYTEQLSQFYLIAAGLCVVILGLFNYFGVTRLIYYLLMGIGLWYCMLRSGIHPTMAGIILAFAIPLRTKKPAIHSPLRKLERNLHPWVAYGILPLFAFANAGLSFDGLSWHEIFTPITLGIICGLFIGKQLGIFITVFLLVKCKWASLPNHATWRGLYGVSLICGVGFTMSLFIGNLAFNAVPGAMQSVRFGVLLGSLLSGLTGYLLLYCCNE